MLAQNAPSQSEAWEARQAIPEFNGGIPRQKGSHRPQGGNLINQWKACREAETEGNIRSRNNQEYRTTHAAGS